MDLQNKTALVTGASRGIGKAIALELARRGAQIALVYAGNEEAAKATAEEIEALGATARRYQCDVASYQQVESLCATVLEDFGKVDILVNNAGITRDKLMMNMSEEDFSDVVDTNLKGAYHTIRHLYRHFSRQRSGRIINISSVSGLSGNVGQANYAASKSGLIGLTKSIARELAGRGVTCNAVAPGFIQTDMTDAMPEKAVDAVLAVIPQKRMGQPEDVAALVGFLAGDAAGYITGEVIRVDGGMCM